MRILACGNRNWDDYHQVCRTLSLCKKLFSDFTLIHGACRGADEIAGRVACVTLELITIAVPAQWAKHGKKAGPIRNERMLRQGKPDLVLAFHDDIDHSKGTQDMVRRARGADVPVVVVRSDTQLSHLEAEFAKIGE